MEEIYTHHSTLRVRDFRSVSFQGDVPPRRYLAYWRIRQRWNFFWSTWYFETGRRKLHTSTGPQGCVWSRFLLTTRIWIYYSPWETFGFLLNAYTLISPSLPFRLYIPIFLEPLLIAIWDQISCALMVALDKWISILLHMVRDEISNYLRRIRMAFGRRWSIKAIVICKHVPMTPALRACSGIRIVQKDSVNEVTVSTVLGFSSQVHMPGLEPCQSAIWYCHFCWNHWQLDLSQYHSPKRQVYY